MFDNNGYSSAFSVLPQENAATIHRNIGGYQNFIKSRVNADNTYKAQLIFKSVDELIRTPILLNRIVQILGGNLYCWSACARWCFPNDGENIEAHDAVTLAYPLGVTAWIAITNTTAENGGCLRLSPAGAPQPVAVPLAAGEACLVAADTQRSVEPNVSSDEALWIEAHYTTPDEIHSDEYATLVRGSDMVGNFRPLPRPASDTDPSAMAVRSNVLAQIGGAS